MLCLSFVYCLLAVSPLCAKHYGGGSAGRPSGGGARYPPSTGYSGNSNTHSGPAHTYPHSTGYSGNTNVHRSTNTHKTEVHHHYHYNPPQHISYGSSQHPTYHGQPPIYVYEYRNSGSRFDSLLTGLALYNLGRMSAGHHYEPGREYRGRSGEICKLRISKSNGEYEESRIDCKLMSSFIWEADRESNKVRVTNTITTVNVTQKSENGSVGSDKTVVTTTVQNTTVVDALKVKGPSLQVTPGMQCFMIRLSRDTSVLQKKVECGLLQEYARSSLRYNGSYRLFPVFVMYVITFIIHLCTH